MDLTLEPLNEIIVEANCDARLPRWDRDNWAPLSLAEVVFFSHVFFS